MDRRVTVKFWQMHPNPIDGVEFGQSLEIIEGLALEQTVTVFEETTYQLDAKPKKGRRFLGDLIRLQSEALPSKLKRGGKAGRLILGDDEALGHHAAFIFDPGSRLLGMEIKPQAAGVLKLLDVVANLAKHQMCVGYPLLDKAAVGQLAGTKNGTFEFRIADPAGLNAVEPGLATVRDNLVFLKEMVDGAYVTVAVGAGPRREGLQQEGLLKTINWLLGERDADRGKIKSIKVVQPHEAEPVLDFVKARFFESEVLPITGDPDRDWPVRENLLVSALAKAKHHVNDNNDD